ncbi:MAG: hypothetical protein JNJ54_10815 [Myxococcaceae bacterium]|nr:hypothetical protein [Myxococcaceae bacterium]
MLSLVIALVVLAPDAGVSLKPTPAGPDAGMKAPADAGAPEAEVAKVKDQVSDLTLRTSENLTALKKRLSDVEAKALALETRTAALEAKLRDATERAAQLDQTRDELASLKRQVNEREDERRRALETRQRFDTATRGLVTADQQLSSGSQASVNEQLRQAEATYTGLAQQYVQAARTALGNNDLATARRMLLLAVLEAQLSRQQ